MWHHPAQFYTDEERREARNAIMRQYAEMAKHLPRLVYDYKNDTVNVYTPSSGFTWKNEKEEKENDGLISADNGTVGSR